MAISPPMSRSNADARSLSSVMTGGSRVPEVSVTQVPFRTRGFGIPASDSACAVAAKSSRHTIDATRARRELTRGILADLLIGSGVWRLASVPRPDGRAGPARQISRCATPRVRFEFFAHAARLLGEPAQLRLDVFFSVWIVRHLSRS